VTSGLKLTKKKKKQKKLTGPGGGTRELSDFPREDYLDWNKAKLIKTP
jgi:hypothetical protein